MDIYDIIDAKVVRYGEIKIQLSAAQTTAMKAGRYVYDLEITSSGGAVSRVVEGQLEVNPGVTY